MPSGTINFFKGIWDSSSSDVFVVGVSETILHYDGYMWRSKKAWLTSEE
ncbi:MAG TPA: hypothetical protein G4O15_11145 [Dehalococcoidia bacterium]|nr:hypothetical protein [Dehalococcoidia bacterium]